MGWRFRKVFRLGSVRWWLARSGIGYSWGFPGFRIGVASNGARYLSVGIPGTGLYFIKHFTQARPSAAPAGQAGTSTPQIPANRVSTAGLPVPQRSSQLPWWRQKNLP